MPYWMRIENLNYGKILWRDNCIRENTWLHVFFVERKMRICESLDILEIEIRESTIGRIFLEGYSHIGD